MANILLVGCGYVGVRFAKIAQAAGHRLIIVGRSAQRLQSLELSAEILEFDWNCEPAASLPKLDIEVLVCCVSHRMVQSTDNARPSNDHVIGLKNFLSLLKSPPRRLVYLSTTGVYASQSDGDWIDEDSPCQPDRPGTVNAFQAETWLRANHSDATIVLRPAGIYGPDRIPNIAALQQGTPIAADPQTFLNLIHVDDLAQVLHYFAHSSPNDHKLFNVADGTPVLRKDYYQFIADRVHAPLPTFADEASPSGPTSLRARSQGNKRVSVQRLQNTFPHPFQYPSYQAGLAPLLPSRA